MRKDKREREENAEHSGLFRVSKDTYDGTKVFLRHFFISNWYTETGSRMKEKKRTG